MKDFIFSNENQPTKQRVGGKAFNLFQLLDLNIVVPKFVVIPNTALQHILQTVNPNNIEQITSRISSFQFSDDHFMDLLDYFEKDILFAVRSSGIDEDGKEKSYAGQFETKLCVPFAELGNAVKQIWLSAYSDRIKIYQKSNSFSQIGNIAVIIQEMIQAETAGVAFGINPLNNHKEEKVINAVYGLGEGLVSGLLTADQYIYRENGIEKIIAEKTEKVVFDENGAQGTIVEKVALNLVGLPALHDDQIIQVAKVLDILEQHYKHPQDIEFAFYLNKLYLLQSRPVTALPKGISEKVKIIWDNSNIIESYPGTTLPLTYSFITKMYEAVYRQLSAVLGISAKKINAHTHVYANMLGLLHGRVYYNLNSWYTSLSLLPGYAVNAEFMEKMMGVKEKFDFPVGKKKTGFKDYWDIAVAIYSILKNLFTVERQRKRFQSYFNKVMMEYEAINFAKKDTHELMRLYFRFEQTLVKKWKAPLVNDFFAMVFFGLLQKQVVKLGFKEEENLHNDLISGSKDIITTEPIELTLKIAALILKNPLATKLFKENDPPFIANALSGKEFYEIQDAIDNYIYLWGDRSVGELKLETITYKQNSENYLRVLGSYVSKGLENNSYFETKNSTVRETAELNVRSKLGGPFKRWFFNYILRKARYFVSNRENLRYQRTRGFGMVRKIFLAMGEKLAQNRILENGRDIFYLTINEIKTIIQGEKNYVNYILLVSERKKQYLQYEKTNLPERMITSDITASDLVVDYNKDLEDHSAKLELKGIGCCAGVVRAKIVVVHSPDEIDDLNNSILVTSSTDPGWVTLFPTCAAILVERGSLLSHSASVSRELGIPCIVGIKDLLQIVKTGMEVEMNGSTGIIKILSK